MKIRIRGWHIVALIVLAVVAFGVYRISEFISMMSSSLGYIPGS